MAITIPKNITGITLNPLKYLHKMQQYTFENLYISIFMKKLSHSWTSNLAITNTPPHNNNHCNYVKMHGNNYNMKNVTLL